MPIVSSKRHQMVFKPIADEGERLQDIENLIGVLREVKINPRVKKMMLDRAVWLVVELSGNFYSRFRSHGTLEEPGKKIQRDHVFTRKQLVSELQEETVDVKEIIERAQCCIVTHEEHVRLNRVPKHIQGWERYRAAQPPVHVRNMETGEEVV